MVSDTLRHQSKLLAPVSKAFTKRLGECGASAKGVFWASPDGQALRFEVLLGIIAAQDSAQGGVTLNDLGCGYGALFDILEDDPLMIDGRYTGYDICPDMIAQAKTRHPDLRVDFILSATATRPADYSVVSGTYNLRMATPAPEWKAYVFANLRTLWDKTKKGLAFNMLAGGGADRPGSLYFAHAGEYLSFCKATLSPKVELKQGYGLDEWTIYVRR